MRGAGLARLIVSGLYAELLAPRGGDGTKELFRRLLEESLRELIDAELTPQIGADPHQVLMPG